MKQLLKKLSAFSVGPIVGAVLSFITVPLITYFISRAEYGRASMFVTAQNTIALLAYLGMDQAFVREFHHQPEGKTGNLLANAMAVPMLCAVVIDVVILCNVPWVSVLLFDTPDERLAVYALVLMIPFMIMENFGLLKIRMEEDGLRFSLFTILLKLWTLVFTVLLLFFWEKSFRSVVYAISLAMVINGVCLYLVSLRKVRFLRQKLDLPLLKRMLLFGLPLIPAYAIGWVLTSMDRIMLRVMCNYDELGLYTGAFKIVSVLSVVQACFTLFWTPVAHRWHKEEQPVSRFDLVSRLVSAVMTALCMMILLCKDIVAVILGPNFAQAIYIFPFIMLYPIMYTMSEATMVGIPFTRKTGYNILVSSLAAVTNIALNYLLIPLWQGRGAAIATGVSYIVFFWARTLISGKLWHRFPLAPFAAYTAVILVNSALHTFARGPLPYVISGISLLGILALNGKGLLRIVRTLRSGEGSGEETLP
ncbi:MAG: oligosaccharide flippase family protein [Oscillospiraceae bacterium]|nr:oligosaccharide flippase family protein [Oscillospiraceae bacterium]